MKKYYFRPDATGTLSTAKSKFHRRPVEICQHRISQLFDGALMPHVPFTIEVMRSHAANSYELRGHGVGFRLLRWPRGRRKNVFPTYTKTFIVFPSVLHEIRRLLKDGCVYIRVKQNGGPVLLGSTYTETELRKLMLELYTTR